MNLLAKSVTFQLSTKVYVPNFLLYFFEKSILKCVGRLDLLNLILRLLY